ncbi:diguanylate cyclase [Luteimonas vadosa]|uniref:diguanylate cyclase n=1 Tax=Luteimonas vadosa TaxID=1165507 RepID=A0ABP9E599_9GAMM
MDAGTCRAAVLSVLLCIAAAPTHADPGFEARLKRADALRTADAAGFAQALDELDRTAGAATAAQKTKLRLLHVYPLILRGDYATAIRELQAVMAAAGSVDTQYRAGAMLANTYAITRQFERGLKTLNVILPLSGEVTDTDTRHHGYAAAGILYNQVGEFGLGLDHANRILAETPSRRNRCIAGNLKLESMQGLGEAPDEASLQAAITQCRSVGEPILVGFSRTYLARSLFAEGKVAKAIDTLERDLQEVEATGYPRLIGDYHALLAEYRLARGDASAAERHAEAAIAHSATLDSAQSLVSAYRTLYEIADRNGDLRTALQRYRQFSVADKAYFNDVKSREMAYQVVRHQSLQQEQQIALLNQQNALLQLQQRVQQQSVQNSRLGMLMLFLVVAFVVLWAVRTKRVQMSLRRMAETDALTGASNRHHFTRQSEATLAQSAAAGEDAALIMFDLDHFKAINDQYGHAAGDWVLRKVVETCRPVCRQVDCFGRLGGEEFAVLLAGHNLRSALRLADDCRVWIAGIDTTESGHRFRVTASFGITTTRISGYDLTRLLSHADRALYRAKRGGRNQVVAFEEFAPLAPPIDRPPAGEPATEDPEAAETRPSDFPSRGDLTGRAGGA